MMHPSCPQQPFLPPQLQPIDIGNNRAPFQHSGLSEDSDYTSDVSAPVFHQTNSSTHQWDSHLHPYRQQHNNNNSNHRPFAGVISLLFSIQQTPPGIDFAGEL
jgi:hypothetical protein